jgi:hypothetical protein
MQNEKKDFYTEIKKPYVPPVTKNNHLIPQFLLRNFCKIPTSNSIYLNTQTNRKLHPNVKEGKSYFPGKFSRNFIFNNDLETSFGKIENLAAPLIKTLDNFSKQYLISDFKDLGIIDTINATVTNLSHFSFTSKNFDTLANLYVSILIRLNMDESLKKSFLIQNEYLINKISNNILQNMSTKKLAPLDTDINNLNNLKSLLIDIEPNHLIQVFNDFYYSNSLAKTSILDYLKKAFFMGNVVLITWDVALLPISNSLPFSWDNKIMYLPVSANSILYVDNNIDSTKFQHIKANTYLILKEYRLYIEEHGYEFLYYDKSMAEIRKDYGNFR